MHRNTITQSENHTALATQNGNIYYSPLNLKDIDGITDVAAAIQQNQEQVDELGLLYIKKSAKVDAASMIGQFAAAGVALSCLLIGLQTFISKNPVQKELLIVPTGLMLAILWIFRPLRRAAGERDILKAQLNACKDVRRELYRKQEVVKLAQLTGQR